MKKEYLDTREVMDFMRAMNGEAGLCVELDDSRCFITAINLTKSIPGKVQARLDLCTESGESINGILPDDVKLYRPTFEDGDYVRQQDGSIIICAGIENGKYLYHAALDPDGNLCTAGEFYKYGSVMSGDRLATDQESMRLNGDLMRIGKVFDPITLTLEDSVFKKNPALFEQISAEAERIRATIAPKDMRSYDKALQRPFIYSIDSDNSSESPSPNPHSPSPNVPASGAALLPFPIPCKRGTLSTIADLTECITAYEARIDELTAQCDKLYDAIKQLNP